MEAQRLENFNDETQTTAQEGPNQLSHVFYRHDLNDRDNHNQRHGRAGAAETEVTTQSEIMKPRLLDCFCGGGGAGYGYHLAGFEVVGVDIEPQKNYPFEFHRADALEFIAAHGQEFDVIHASPPCQAHSSLNTIWKRQYKDYIEATRDLIIKTGKSYIIENVMGAPLINPIMLCGTMFGLRVIRHRLFETNPPLYFLNFTCTHHSKVVKKGHKPDRAKQFASVVGHFNDIEYAKRAMGIDWMVQSELSQAIPPAYTRWIGERLLEALAV